MIGDTITADAERERLHNLGTWLERATDALEAVRAGLDRHAIATERLADWEACARAMRQRVPQDARSDVATAWAGLYAAAHRLRTAAHRLGGCLRALHDDLLARWCRGCIALADTVTAGLTSGDALAAEVGGFTATPAIDHAKVAAIGRGLRLVTQAIHAEEQRASALHLAEHRRYVAGMRSAGLGEIADRIEADPELCVCLATLARIAVEHGAGHL